MFQAVQVYEVLHKISMEANAYFTNTIGILSGWVRFNSPVLLQEEHCKINTCKTMKNMNIF